MTVFIIFPAKHYLCLDNRKIFMNYKVIATY